jgi:GR25 family glycosyltransferase involved in LPS biosynthesis
MQYFHARFPQMRERASLNGTGSQLPILSSKNTKASMQLREAQEFSEPAKAAAPARAVIPVYVISLPNAEARRRDMTLRLGAVGIPFTFVDALYGRTVPIPDVLDGARVMRERFKTESGLGCTVSHRLLHRVIAEGDAETVLVLEDDATIPEDFAEVIEQALAFDFDVFKLEGVNTSTRRLTIGHVGRYEVIITSRPSVGSAAYLLRRDAARRICGLPVLDQGSDYVFQDPRLRLRVLEMHPFCVQQDSASGTQLHYSPVETYVPRSEWSFDRLIESTRRKLMMGRIYGPLMLARFELQRLRPVRTGLFIFRWAIFFAVVIALAVGLWLIW